MSDSEGRMRPIMRNIAPGKIETGRFGHRSSNSDGWMRACIFSAMLLLCWALVATAWSQTRVIERYSYDAAGNIVGIETQVVDGPPLIDGIEPDRIFAGTSREFIITGTNLASTSVTPDQPGLSVSAVQADEDQIIFTLTADPDAETGVSTLTVGSSIGSDSVDILVRPELPRLIADPVPLVVVADGGEAVLGLSLAEPASTDWLLEVELDDATIATLSVAEIEVAAGQVAIPGGILATGGNEGSTRLRIAVEGVVLLDTSVISTVLSSLAPGDWEFFSRPLGVTKQRPITLRERGPVVGRIGMLREFEPPPSIIPVLTAGPVLGVARGAVLTGVSPESVDRHAGQTELTLLGFGLSSVNEVEIIPNDGLSVSAPTPAADGRSVVVTLTIDPDAQVGLRRAVARANGQAVESASPMADRFYLAGSQPRIDSIDPILMNPGTSATLTVRGVNFSQTAELTIEPSAGIAVDAPLTISPDQDRIHVQIHVAADAAEGPRLMRVITAAGSSSEMLEPANTLEVTVGELVTVPLFDTRHLTVLKGEASPSPGTITALATAPLLGIGKGPLVTEIEPRILEVGGETRLIITGHGLDLVSEVIVDPDDGLILGPVDGSDDLLEVTITVDEDAPRGLRALRVLTPDGPMTLARPELGTVRVVSPQPVVEGINPVYIEPGASAVTVTISGRNFQQAEAVRVLPQANLTLGSFSVAADGREITLSIAAASGADIGPRIVHVETPAGISSTEATTGNQLYIGDPMERLVTPLIGPLLEVERQVVLVEPETRHAFSPLLGVQKPVFEQIETTRLAFSDQAGVTRGAVLSGIEPSIVPRGFEGELILPGFELGLDVVVVIESGEGIQITGPVVVETDADENRFVRVPVAVDEQAPAMPHRLVVAETSAEGESPIPFVTPHAGQLQVAGPTPVIESISPILALPDQVLGLTIRGLNFDQATEVRVTPDQAIIVGSNFAINADGTELTVNLDIGEAAEPGPRLIQVIGPAGESDETATAANTLTIVEP